MLELLQLTRGAGKMFYNVGGMVSCLFQITTKLNASDKI